MSPHFRLPSIRRRRLAALPALGALAFLATPALPAYAVTPSADLATNISPIGMWVAGRPYPVLYPQYGVPFTITVTNHGPDHTDGVVMSDNWTRAAIVQSVSATAPAGVSCTAPPAGSYAIGTVTCTTRSLAPGASMTIHMKIGRILAFPHSLLQDTATATSTTFDPNTTNNTATVIAELM